MSTPPDLRRLSSTFIRFFQSGQSSAILLGVCVAIAMLLANSAAAPTYFAFWEVRVGGMSLSHWVNDALMAVFFLLIGLELERELYSGELSTLQSALLPAVAAVGGMLAPALIHLALNFGTPTEAGFGIPMATDIAFALGVLALLGNRVPASLKVFVVAFAVIDDLGAIVTIAVFYTAQISWAYMGAAVAVWTLLAALNWKWRVMALAPYLLGGVVMWFLLLQSGLHATLAGVALAFAVPFSARDNDLQSPSHRLENILHKPVAFFILPVFALANAGVVVGADWLQGLSSVNSLGILAGLVLGKPLGIALACIVAVAMGVCKLPDDLTWRHILGAGMLGGIGFTMSIFIANIAFADAAQVVNASKMAILFASITAAVLGFAGLRLAGNSPARS